MPATLADTSAFSNRAMSELGSMPSAPKRDACILKWLQSSWKSFNAPAVEAPNWTGSGYRASLPLKALRLISHSMGQSRMQRGHMPLVGETSLTRVVVPLVDLPFR